MTSSSDLPSNAAIGMLTPPAFTPSKSQVNAAGARLAKARRLGEQLSADETLEAIRVIDAWRQLHAEPLACGTTCEEGPTGRVLASAQQKYTRVLLEAAPRIPLFDGVETT